MNNSAKVVLLMSASFLTSFPALAQEVDPEISSSSGSEEYFEDPSEILVTATRRSTALSDVPISIAAESQASLDEKGVKDIAGIGRITPGLTFAPGFNRSNNIAIRGIASNVGASTTGVYIDDTPIQIRQIGAGRASGTAFPVVFDLDRVEVLRGPQGTLFGASSQGGTIRFITPEPGLSRSSMYSRAELSLTDGGDPSYEAGVAYGGPIVADTLGIRLSAYYRKQGGWADRRSFRDFGTVHKNENSDDALVIRGAVTWEPIPDVRLTPAFTYQRTTAQGSGLIWDTLLPSLNGTTINGNPQKDRNRDRFILPSLKAEIDLGFASLVSNTSYFSRWTNTQTDYTTFHTEILTGTLLSLPPVNTYSVMSEFINKQKTFTQEVRLQSNGSGPLSWVVGAFYQKAKQSAENFTPTSGVDDFTLAVYGVNSQTAFGYPLLPITPQTRFQQPLTAHLFDTSIDEQLAAFGQVDYQPAEWITLTAGLRYADTKFSFTNLQEGQLAGGLTSGVGTQQETPLTPKFGVSIRPADGQLIYATAAKGFRMGGANAPVSPVACSSSLAAFGLTAAPDTYDSDSVWSYEVGTKNKLLDNRVTVSASGYYINWSNIQRQVSLQCGYFFIANTGSATSKGFDASIDAEPVDGLRLSVSAAYNKATYDQDIFGGIINPATGERALLLSKGDRIGVSPWTVHLGGEYRFNIGGSSEAYFRADYDYRSSFQGAAKPPAVNFDPLFARIPAVHFASLRAGADFEKWNVSVFVDNVTNRDKPLGYGHTSVVAPLIVHFQQRPRTVGITASHRF